MMDAVISQGSSHFSTMAVTLVWARFGTRFHDRYYYLDHADISSGLTPNAFIDGSSFNLWPGTTFVFAGPSKLVFVFQYFCLCCCHPTPRVIPEVAPWRWYYHTYRFVSGLRGEHSEINDALPAILIEDAGSAIRFENGVGYMPETVFYQEAARWVAPHSTTWPTECPMLSDVPDHVFSAIPDRAHALSDAYERGRKYYFSKMRYREACECMRLVMAWAARALHSPTPPPDAAPLQRLYTLAETELTAWTDRASVYTQLIDGDSVRLVVPPLAADADVEHMRMYYDKIEKERAMWFRA
jgi:hypothetical protein